MAGDVRAQSTYVGSESCKDCHEETWNDHRVSAHPHALRSAADAAQGPLPIPDGHDWADVAYVVGGLRSRARYVDAAGHLVTASPVGSGDDQFVVATGEWVDVDAGEDVPFDCGACHTTGYSAAGHQDGRSGIVGTWAFDGVECEQCHGPASDHVAFPSSLNITRDDGSCADCHSRGDATTIAAAGGFVRDRQAANELLASPHASLSCTECHDPHRKAELSIRKGCTDCHAEMAKEKSAFAGLGRKHLDRGVGCVECHMPRAVRSAVAGNAYAADHRSHQFRISVAPGATMFDPDGLVATGTLTPAYACLGCHEEVVEKFAAKGAPWKAESWARKRAKKIHE